MNKRVYKMKIKLYNKIAACGLERLPADFETAEDFSEYDGVLVRSADLHGVEFPASLRAVARAGAGVNNIPCEELAKKGVVVFNTPGANANAVRELAVAALLLTSRRVTEAAEWTKTLSGNPDALKIVEKEKSKFQGPEILGKTLGVIGLGAVGGGLANAACALGMRVLGYDPFVSVGAAWALDPRVKKVDDLDTLYAESDYLSVHVPSLPSTRGMIGKDAIAKMKDGVRILNLARADLAVDEDVLKGIEKKKIAAYFTDFPTGALAGKAGVVATPHLGASTPEAEDNCAVMACEELRDFLLNGNVRNSVNFPAVSQSRSGKYRVGVFCLADPETEAALSKELFGGAVSKGTRNGVTYLICDRDAEFDLEKIKAVNGVIRVTAT